MENTTGKDHKIKYTMAVKMRLIIFEINFRKINWIDKKRINQ